MSKQTLPQVQIPAGMVEVTKEQFFSKLWAEKKDIMPTTEQRLCTLWRVQHSRILWGWDSTGWGSPSGAPEIYALSKLSA